MSGCDIHNAWGVFDRINDLHFYARVWWCLWFFCSGNDNVALLNAIRAIHRWIETCARTHHKYFKEHAGFYLLAMQCALPFILAWCLKRMRLNCSICAIMFFINLSIRNIWFPSGIRELQSEPKIEEAKTQHEQTSQWWSDKTMYVMYVSCVRSLCTSHSGP